MSEYHKIETLYERDEQTHRLRQPLALKNRVYGALKSWHFTEKIDGTNIRLIWTRDTSTFSIGGRTANAQLPAELITYLHGLDLPTKFAAMFSEDVVIYGEGFGAGIQKVGVGYGPLKRFIMFDVLVGGKWWLAWENVCDVAVKFGLPVVPYLGEMTLDDATQMVRAGFTSQLGAIAAEGLVGRPVEPLFDKKGARLILKLKTRDF